MGARGGGSLLRLTICQLPNDDAGRVRAWAGLCEHVRESRSGLVLLPEMPFAPWPCTTAEVDPEVWRAAVAAHARWLGRMDELGAAAIATRPVTVDGRPHNRGFAVEAGEVREVHDKFYLPDEDGYREATWYRRGDGRFEVAEVAGARVGMQICTEVWFLERSRAYGRDGAQLIVVPRATPRATTSRWLAAGRTAAVVAGAWCASSNLVEPPGSSPADLGGTGWLFDPEGEPVAFTSEAAPFVTVEIDLAAADAAKAGYPRYVRE